MNEIILNSKYKKKILQINKSQLLKYLKNKKSRQNSLKIPKNNCSFKFSKKSLSTLVTNENSKKINVFKPGKIGVFVSNANYFKCKKKNILF